MKLGLINVNKPSGVSSGFVVNRIKHLTGCACGHMGTLDPLAEGVLPVGVGNASRLFDYFLQKKKQYIATFRFGVDSDTLDSTGNITSEGGYVPTKEELLAMLPTQVGKIAQIPPKYSAKSVGGKRGYQLARKGVEFALEAKEVEIDKIELLSQVSEDSFTFLIDCGAGTYIRSIVRDLANACSTFGIMTALKRTKSGIFTIENSVELNSLTAENVENYILPTDEALSLPTIEIADEHIFHGVSQPTAMQDGLYKIYQDGSFYGLVQVEKGSAKIKTKLC